MEKSRSRESVEYFNSRPSARGDIVLLSTEYMGEISIHAPPRGATRRTRRIFPEHWNFNSRPSARGDETMGILGAMHGKFQFTPLREGRHNQIRVLARHGRFQFTPLREGRLQNRRKNVICLLFQFTPLREGRRCEERGSGDWQNISIHAPPRGATRCTRTTRSKRNYFNSRPSARGDGKVLAVLVCTNISIHAPPRGATTSSPALPSITAYFNSRPSARGDSKRYAISANLLFNPYKSAWLNNRARQFVEIILVIFHRIIA